MNVLFLASITSYLTSVAVSGMLLNISYFLGTGEM